MKTFLLAASGFLIYSTCISQNVGIDIPNPVFKLDVRNGSINTDSVYRISGYTFLAGPGTGNLFIGKNAGKINTGMNNTFSGDLSGISNTTGHSNSFYGKDAGSANANGSSNCFFGRYSGYFNTDGNDNSFFGRASGFVNTTGSSNSFFGI